MSKFFIITIIIVITVLIALLLISKEIKKYDYISKEYNFNDKILDYAWGSIEIRLNGNCKEYIGLAIKGEPYEITLILSVNKNTNKNVKISRIEFYDSNKRLKYYNDKINIIMKNSDSKTIYGIYQETNKNIKFEEYFVNIFFEEIQGNECISKKDTLKMDTNYKESKINYLVGAFMGI